MAILVLLLMMMIIFYVPAELEVTCSCVPVVEPFSLEEVKPYGRKDEG